MRIRRRIQWSMRVYQATSAARTAVEGKNIHHHCLHVIVELERSSIMRSKLARNCHSSIETVGPFPLRAFFQFPIAFSKVAWSILDCASRSSTFRSCAFREHRRPTGHPPILLLFPHFALKGSSQTVLHCAHRTAPSERARSASKKDGLAAPLPFFL
jgi:hypothetical protein